ncbi:phosphatidate cytidylyltransferase [Oceanobacillus kapialis]|uniref:Phosphatidate cytidylyltransferase n=1 Tax=Oceanobacillus kapialis TaxID=481353 RepID=A0ABW5PYG4_9BACI
MKQRILTAIIALIIFVPFVIYGGLPFEIFVYVLATIGLIELMRMRQLGKYSISSALGILLLWMIMLPEEFGFIPLPESLYQKSDVIMLVVLLLLSYTVLVKNRFTFDHAGFIILSTIYVGMGFSFLIETRNLPDDGLATIAYVFLIIWATDTGAYFFGRAFGKKKLWPKISPNKTIEGAVGGVLLACIVAIIFHLFNPIQQHSLLALVMVTVLASIFGQIGDLVESAFKRHYGVKDSGDILPGHGGILDRFDSMLFVLPVLHFIGFV